MIFRRGSRHDERCTPASEWSSIAGRRKMLRFNSGAEGRIPEALRPLKNGRSTEYQTFRVIQNLFRSFTHGRTMDVGLVSGGAEGSEVTSEGAFTVMPVVLVSW